MLFIEFRARFDQNGSLRVGGPLQGPDLLMVLAFPWVENPRLVRLRAYLIREVKVLSRYTFSGL